MCVLREGGSFCLLPKCADIDVDVNSSTQQHTLASSSSSSPSTSSSSFASSISYKRGPSPLVSRLLKRLRAPASSSRVPVRVLTALSFTDADALLAARVEKAEITETELISLLHKLPVSNSDCEKGYGQCFQLGTFNLGTPAVESALVSNFDCEKDMTVLST